MGPIGEHPDPATPAQPAWPPRFDLFSEPLAEGIHCVTVRGELDLNTSGRFAATLAMAIDGGRLPLLLDLSECGFVDSTGLQAIFSAHRAARRRDGHGGPVLAIAVHDPNVRSLFRLTALDGEIPVLATRAEAISLLQGTLRSTASN